MKVFSDADVRAWARANGYDIADRGRIPVAVVAAYEAAHQEGSPESQEFVTGVSAPDDDALAAAGPDPSEAPPTLPAGTPSDPSGWDSHGHREPQAPWTPRWAPPPAPAAPPAYAAPPWGVGAAGPGWGGQAPPPPPPSSGREGFSVISLVLGIIPILGGILGVVFGIIALRRIRRSHQEGRGFAIAGIVMGSGWLVLIAALIAFGVGNAERGPDGSVIAGGSVTGTGLRVGDCPSSIPSGEVITVDLVPCGKPHRAEVYGEFRLSGTGFPGKAEVARFAGGDCTDRLIAFVGRSRAKELEIHFVVPTAEGWDQDHRTIHCLLAAPGGGMLPSGSAKTP